MAAVNDFWEYIAPVERCLSLEKERDRLFGIA